MTPIINSKSARAPLCARACMLLADAASSLLMLLLVRRPSSSRLLQDMAEDSVALTRGDDVMNVAVEDLSVSSCYVSM